MSEASESDLATIRQVNRLCDQFESACQSEEAPQIDGYLEGIPQDVLQAVVPQLVALEIDYRKMRGELPVANEYSSRFEVLDPQWLDQLCTLSKEADSTTIESNQKDTASRLPPGTHLGDYVIGPLLGTGGMGAVYQATHVPMQRQVALKVIRGQATSSLSLKRFRQEVFAAARLSHPNVVRAYDAGEHEGLYYLAMELIDGEDLHRRVLRSGPLSVEESVQIIRQAAQGLAHAHRQSIVHRDVKPANLMITDSGEVKLLDVGLARLVSRPHLLNTGNHDHGSLAPETKATASGLLMGTIDYLAPEQAAEPSTASSAADIYGLGCTWKFLVTGKPCYAQLPMIQRLVAHQVGPVPSLRDEIPNFPRALDRLFQRMVAKRPDRRPASMEEVLESLDTFEPRDAKQPLRNRRLTWSLAAMGLIVLGAVFYRGMFHNEHTAPTIATVHASPPDVALPNTLPQTENREQVQWQAAIRLKIPLHRMGQDGMQFVLIPPGHFLMGTNQAESDESHASDLEFPQHRVTISQPFYLAQTETTVAQFREFIEATGYVTRPELPGGTAWGQEQGAWRRGRYSWKEMGEDQPTDDRPVTNLSWFDAQAYCDWLNESTKGSLEYRLPTEAEWEYACRAGSNSPWGHGNDVEELAEYAWYAQNSGRMLRPIATKRPNVWGLYDMHGNASEWCRDRFGPADGFYDSRPKIDPNGSPFGSERIQRGGNVLSTAHDVRSASRVHQEANEPTKGGFRVAMDVSELPSNGATISVNVNSP